MQRIKQKEWITKHFPKDTRYETIILSSNFEDGNILVPETLLYVSCKTAIWQNGHHFCHFQLLDVHFATLNVTSNLNDTFSDLCLLTDDQCATTSILKIWQYNKTAIQQLSHQDILDDITTTLNNTELDSIDKIDGLLSGIEYDPETGKVLRASALMNVWILSQSGSKDADLLVRAMEWENAFISEIILGTDIPDNLSFTGLAERR